MAEGEGGYDFYLAEGVRERVDALDGTARADWNWIREELLRDPTDANPNVRTPYRLLGSYLMIRRRRVAVTFVRLSELVSFVAGIEISEEETETDRLG